MKAMIFAAGLGSRFKPWTDKHPKALALVNGKSLLQRNIEYLSQYGITELIINVHHFSKQIISEIQKNKGWGSNIHISDETAFLLETGGGLLNAQKYFSPSEQLLLCNVDILTNLNLNTLLDFHRQHQPLITTAVTNRSSSRNFLWDENDRLCGWKNSSTGEIKISIHHSPLAPKAYSCISILEYSIFELMKKNNFQGKFSITDVYVKLASHNTILGYDHSGDLFIDVGTTENAQKAATLFF